MFQLKFSGEKNISPEVALSLQSVFLQYYPEKFDFFVRLCYNCITRE